MYLGILFILSGCLLWVMEEKNALLNWTITLSIALIAIGAFLLLETMEHLFKKTVGFEKEKKIDLYTWHWFYIMGLIFMGTIAYTIASYLHLKMDEWTFLKALLIALPFVFIEYQFMLRGIYYAKQHLLMNGIQILTITTIFCCFNSLLMNYFVLQLPIVLWREMLSVVFLLMAFFTSTSL
jgi:hypothetical protein